MRELRIRDMPNELYLSLEAEAKRKGLSLRSFLVAELWWLIDGTKPGKYHGTEVGQIEVGQKRDKIAPPDPKAPLNLTPEQIAARRDAEREECERVRKAMEG